MPNYECFDCSQSNFNVFCLLYWIAAGRIVRTNNNDIYHQPKQLLQVLRRR